MKRLYYFEMFEQLLNPKFKLIKDYKGNQIIVWKKAEIDEEIIEIQDKTEFESVENHIHILDNVKKDEFDSLCNFGQTLCTHLLFQLKQQYPDKKFVVYVSIGVGESMIIRYHQNWVNELHYYDKEISSKKERLIKCVG